jgi:hypothetical protein
VCLSSSNDKGHKWHKDSHKLVANYNNICSIKILKFYLAIGLKMQHMAHYNDYQGLMYPI